jgi:hypothetical protein
MRRRELGAEHAEYAEHAKPAELGRLEAEHLVGFIKLGAALDSQRRSADRHRAI